MAGIIRYCKLEEERSGENVFDCARPSIFGNPYTHIKGKSTLASVTVKSRDEAIHLYEPYFEAAMAGEDEFCKAFQQEFERMCDAYKKYGTVYLGCYCRTSETCHCDVIRKKLIARILKEKLSNVCAS